MCQRLTRDALSVEEMLQHASVQFWRFWQHKPEAETFALMLTACRRFYYNQRDKEENQKKHLAYLFLAKRLPSIGQPATEDHTVDLLRQLPALWSEVLDRAFVQRQTNKEIAAAMRLPVTTIKNWRLRGLQKLRRMIQSK
jgi:DNA-directed RNA polymerase specialized sigma24 family protein